MEALQQARHLYQQRHQQQGLAIHTDLETYQLEEKIQRLIEIAVKEVPSVILFQTPDYLQMFERALKVHSQETTEVERLARAYEGLEKYFLQLVEQPWKREFKKIKLYGGFYQTRIKSALPEPESIFRHAGYTVLPARQVMTLEGAVRTDALLVLAFDSRLCAHQCRVITEHYQVVKGLSMSLEQAMLEVLYSDRSRGRHGNQVLPPPGYDSGALQVSLKGVPARSVESADCGYLDMSAAATRVPRVPERQPIPADQRVQGLTVSTSSSSSNGRFHAPDHRPTGNHEAALLHLQSQKVERQSDDFEGTTDEHILRSLQAVNHLTYPNPQPTGTASAVHNNGHFDSKEWDYYYQLQMQRKRGFNQQSAVHADHASNSALLLEGVNTTTATITQKPTFVYPSPTTNMGGGRQRLSTDSFDEGIEKDLPPMSKSSREAASPRYPSLAVKPGPPQAKVHSSSLQPSMVDQGYSTAPLGSNGYHGYHPAGPASAQVPTHQQSSGVYTDGVHSPPVTGPPPIPPRSLKPSPKDSGHLASTPVPCVDPRVVSSCAGMMMPPSYSSAVRGHSTVSRGDATQMITGNNNIGPSEAYPSTTSPTPMRSRSGPVLRSALGKSSSLKYASDSSPHGGGNSSSASLLHQAQQSRAARSMDLSRVLEWQCQRCTALNVSSDTVCVVCSCSRQSVAGTTGGRGSNTGVSGGGGNSLGSPMVPGVSKKPCPKCTLENDADRTHCSLCEAKLEDPFTYV